MIEPSGDEVKTKYIVSVTIIGIVAGMIPVLQPLLLGGLSEAGRIDVAKIGYVAMAESLASAAVTGIAAALLPPVRIRTFLIASLLLAVAANIATMFVAGPAIVVARIFSGFGCGIAIWVFVTLLTRARQPARIVAIYATVQSCLGLIIASAFSVLILPTFGPSGAYFLVALIYCAALCCIPFTPDSFVASSAHGSKGLPTGRGLIALSAVFLQLAATIAIWVYALPIAQAFGHSIATARLAVSVAIGAQILGGLFAAAFASRLPALPAVLGCNLVALIGLPLICWGGAAGLIIGLSLIAFGWMCGASMAMPLLLKADPSRRAGLQMSTAQSFGAAAGPAIAAACVGAFGAQSVVILGGAMFAVTSLLAIVSVSTSPSS